LCFKKCRSVTADNFRLHFSQHNEMVFENPNERKIMPSPIPAGFHTLSPHLIVPDGAQAIEFYKKAFGAREQSRLLTPDGKTVMHAQLTIGNSVIMLGGEMPPRCLAPKSRGGTSVFLHIYTEDADAAFDRAVKAGCTVNMPMSDTFWGDRYGQVEDPFGHLWSIATHKHDYTQEQVAANAKVFFANMPKQ
jgi:PhnB protein